MIVSDKTSTADLIVAYLKVQVRASADMIARALYFSISRITAVLRSNPALFEVERKFGFTLIWKLKEQGVNEN